MALQVADRACIMRNGEIVREDISKKLLDMADIKDLFLGGNI